MAAQGERQLLLPQRPQPRPRARSTGGEIVQVQGGHIVRSTGGKDRHSKVCTAKGPRDRRVRLSAHTAIQFYDVQDRLGYDRPSKAVDWLIKHAKDAIDELAELPPWHPSTTSSSSSTAPPPPHENLLPSGNSGKKPLDPDNNAFTFLSGSTSSFLPPSLDSDSIADTIKSFFPMAAAAAAAGASNESSSSYQNYAPPPAQDLRLSLQSFQDQHHHVHSAPTPHSIFSFDPGPSPWWNMPPESSSGGAYGYGVAPPPAMSVHPLVLGHSPLVTQRGPLQSSNSPSLRAWMDPVNAAAAASGVLPMLHPSSLSSVSAMGGGAAGVGFSGFRMPARFQGEEEHDGLSDKPSSASSASRH